jgi:hypothetical protein
MIHFMETKISLKYNGAAVDAGRMDVYMASANMIAFSEFMVIATKATFGETATANAEVAGFGHSSFVTNLLFSFGGDIATIFTSVPADHLMKVVKEAIGLWKFLKGSPPKAVEYAEQHVKVTNNNGNILLVQAQTFNLVMNEKASSAVEKFIKSPLSANGIDTLTLDGDFGHIGDIDKSEAQHFIPVAASVLLNESSFEMSLVIESPSFKDGNKWKVWDGAQSFFVEMLDLEFIERINGGERFGKGDVLRAEVRFIQKRVGGKLEAERSVTKVIEHRAGQFQYPLV